MEPSRRFEPTARARVRRIAQRGVYDRAVIDAILDEALICHVGFVDDGQPYVLPTIHVRVGDRLYLHGSRGSRMLRRAASGDPLCVTVTLIDALVLARSAFHHSMNYRSAVVLGPGRAVTEPEEKRDALLALVDHVVPGRNREARLPDAGEIEATEVIAIALAEASAKVRTGPPVDEARDYDLPIWAGLLPLEQVARKPVEDTKGVMGLPVPDYLLSYGRGRG